MVEWDDDEIVRCTLAPDLSGVEVAGDVERTLGHPAQALAEGRAFWGRLFEKPERALELFSRGFAGERASGTLCIRTGTADRAWVHIKVRPRAGGVALTLLRLVERGLDLDGVTMGERLLRLVNQAPVAVFALTPEGICELSEGGALAAAGLRPGQLVGVNWLERFPDSALARILPRVLAGEPVLSQASIGDAIYVNRYFLERDADGRPIRIMGFSIEESARVRAEERLAERTAELEHALARETESRALAEAAVRQRDEFLSIASHELRTPLAALQLAVQSLARIERQRDCGPRVLEAAATAERGSRRLVELVDVLFDVSRLQAGIGLQPRELDLVVLVRDMVAEAQRVSPAAIELVAPTTLRGVWDGDRLEQVIRNLLSNANKYGLGKPIEVRVVPEPSAVLLEVLDQGIGVPEDSRVRIFDRCERAVSPQHYGGLGLGLYVVRRIVEAHGGTCGVEAAPVEGSRFWVRLPKNAAEAPPRVPVPS